MADITTSTKISESTREVVYAFQYQYVDGGNESAVSKIDVSGLTKMRGSRDTKIFQDLVVYLQVVHTEQVELATLNSRQQELVRQVMPIRL